MIGTATAMIIAASISAGTATAGSVYASKKQGKAAKDASKYQGAATARAERLEKAAEAVRVKERAEEIALAKQAFDAEQAELARQTAEEQRRYELTQGERAAERARDAELLAEDRRRYEATETRLKPYREAGEVSLRELAALAAGGGTRPSQIQAPPSRFPTSGRPMPELIQSASQPAGAPPPNVQFRLAELDPRWNRGVA